MIPLALLRTDKEEILKRLALRNIQAKQIIEKALLADRDKRSLQTTLEQNLSRAKKLSKQISELYREGKRDEAEALKKQSSELKEAKKLLEKEFRDKELLLKTLLLEIPNIPHASVPAGNSSEDNQLIRKCGTIPSLGPDAKTHWEIAEQFRIIDFELGNKITGAGFPVYLGKGARLQRALISFFLDEALKAGYDEVLPPLAVNEASAYGTGQLPDKEGQMYSLKDDDYYLIPTAEVPITNLYRNVILKEEDLPVKHAGYSACFRREAGSYGKDVRGLNRLHQFDKVEIVQLVKPESSYRALDEMLLHVGKLLNDLKLPYRIVKLCGADLGFAAAMTFDFEVFSAAQQKWLEVSSVSNFESFQANRLKLRYKTKEGKTQLLHTLNGSALALPRIVAALLENNQTPEGVSMPHCLRKYTGFDLIN